MSEVRVQIENSKQNIIIGALTWLHSGVHSSEVLSLNYNIYMRDRPTDCHGGVLAAVKSNLIITPVYFSIASELYYVSSVKINFNWQHIPASICLIPPTKLN